MSMIPDKWNSYTLTWFASMVLVCSNICPLKLGMVVIVAVTSSVRARVPVLVGDCAMNHLLHILKDVDVHVSVHVLCQHLD